MLHEDFISMTDVVTSSQPKAFSSNADKHPPSCVPCSAQPFSCAGLTLCGPTASQKRRANPYSKQYSVRLIAIHFTRQVAAGTDVHSGQGDESWLCCVRSKKHSRVMGRWDKHTKTHQHPPTPSRWDAGGSGSRKDSRRREGRGCCAGLKPWGRRAAPGDHGLCPPSGQQPPTPTLPQAPAAHLLPVWAPSRSCLWSRPSARRNPARSSRNRRTWRRRKGRPRPHCTPRRHRAQLLHSTPAGFRVLLPAKTSPRRRAPCHAFRRKSPSPLRCFNQHGFPLPPRHTFACGLELQPQALRQPTHTLQLPWP